jgi:hypothetical protein
VPAVCGVVADLGGDLSGDHDAPPGCSGVSGVVGSAA